MRIIERVFDQVSGWWGTRYEYDPPRPVWLDLRQALPPQRLRQDDIPLRVRAAGVDIARVEPAELLAWQQTCAGDWYAEVRATLTNRNGQAQREATLLSPADAISPRENTDR